MPLYVAECPEHGEFETILTVSQLEKDGVRCEDCQKASRIILQPVATIGPMPSKPVKIDQIGQSFTSRSEMRRYFDAHPGRCVVENNSQQFINHRDAARGKAEKKAKALGFNDLEDRKVQVKADRAVRSRIEKEGPKVQR